MLIHRSPDQASVQMRTTTSLNAGSWKCVKLPLRASISQVASKAKIENTRVKAQYSA